MFKGTLYFTYDINLCIANLNTCKTIIIADEPDRYNLPGKIGGSILLPPYEALACIIDGDDEKFRYEYLNYLNNDITANKFINIILQALIVGTNMIILLDPEGPKFDMILREYFIYSFGIYIGDGSNQFGYDQKYIPSILNRLYADDDIDAGFFLRLYPVGVNYDPFILKKLQFDCGINGAYFNDTMLAYHFNKISKVEKNGGVPLKNVVKRLESNT